MDDESKQLLRQILETQTAQAELLQKYLPPLWTRIRFSLLGLLLLMTLVAAGLGFTVVTIRSLKPSVPPTPTVFLTGSSGIPTQTWTSSGTLQLNGGGVITTPSNPGDQK